VPVTVFLHPGFQRYTAYVHDLSLDGVGLYLTGPALCRGVRLLVQLPGRLGGTAHTALAEVVRRVPQRGGHHLVGCKFLCRLRPGELHERFHVDGEPSPPLGCRGRSAALLGDTLSACTPSG
jgi:hypothetical protein